MPSTGAGRTGLLACFASALACCGMAMAAEAEKPAERPLTYALVSAVGDQFSLVRKKVEVGSHLEPYRRATAKVPGDSLNAAVLRGLDKAIAEREPESKRVFLKLNPVELEGVSPQDRERVAIGKLATVLESMPERKEWDRIVVVTPTYFGFERAGMGSKLEGIGVYIQPLYSGRIGNGVNSVDVDNDGSQGLEATTPGGKPVNTRRYLAPYFYVGLWVLDAKTLEVLERESRYDFSRLYDPDSVAIDVGKSFTPEQVVENVVKFVERSSARALREAIPEVTVGEPKRVNAPK